MTREQRRYVSYLLRLWQAEHNGARVWRAFLESAHTGERRGFADLAELYAYLRQETAAISTQATKSDTHPRRNSHVRD